MGIPFMGITGRIVLLALLTTVLATGLLGWLGYRAENAAAMRGVESRLRAMAASVPEVIAPGYHARARRGEVTQEEFDALLEALTRMAGRAGVVYVYTCLEDEAGRIVFASSGITEEERQNGTGSGLLEVYAEPPAELQAVFRDGVSRFASYTDEYGEFHSIFAAAGEGDDRHVIGVDVGLGDLAAIARRNMLWYLAVGSAVALVVSLVGVWAGHRVAAPIVNLAREIDAYSDAGFPTDAAPAPALLELRGRDGGETGRLAGSFVDMQKKLASHVQELTRVTAERERMTSQLDIARRIQRGLLPTEAPAVANFDIAGWSEAADETSGDYYDWIFTPGGQVIVSIADVAGHGIGPAIMASVCRAYARATLHERDPLERLLERLNRHVHADTLGAGFVTFFTGVLDPVSRSMLAISAGHGPVLLYRAAEGTIEELATHGLPLGVIDSAGFDPCTRLSFDVGDVLFLVSDGFFEWKNVAGEQFGTDRLRDSLKRAAALGLSSEAIIDSVRRDVTTFTAGTTQPDDMTAVAIRLVDQA